MKQKQKLLTVFEVVFNVFVHFSSIDFHEMAIFELPVGTNWIDSSSFVAFLFKDSL